MNLEILLEEPSAGAALSHLVPKILGTEISFRLYTHQGKLDLLKKLPARLRAYARFLPADSRIVVLLDADGQDCRQLKEMLQKMAQAAGLLTTAGAPLGRFQVLNRIAIEELEAWFFGDVAALCAAYPRVPPTLEERAAYRDPDAIRGGTCEALERELMRSGYHLGGLAKIKAAREISAHMDPARNRSRSFQVFRQGLLDLVRA